jgi:hypothetical protein
VFVALATAFYLICWKPRMQQYEVHFHNPHNPGKGETDTAEAKLEQAPGAHLLLTTSLFPLNSENALQGSLNSGGMCRAGLHPSVTAPASQRLACCRQYMQRRARLDMSSAYPASPPHTAYS